MLGGLTDKFRGLRSQTVTGIGLTSNSLRMMGVVLAPFMLAWAIIKMFYPEMYDQLISLAFGGWLIWVVVVWAWAKSDANNYIVFPQSKWKFPNGDCRTFDLKVPQDGWVKLEEFKDGTKGYKVWFDDTYEYDDPSLPFPRTWRLAYWELPDFWDLTFARRAFGEFPHKGVFVTKPDCEDISVYVMGWETVDAEHFPVCKINDCAFRYREAMQKPKLSIKQVSRLNALHMLFRDARKKVDNLNQHTAYLEDRVEVAEKDSSEDFKDSADNRLKAVRKRHARVMDTKESVWTRIKNLKTFAFAILIIPLVFLVGRFVFHIW